MFPLKNLARKELINIGSRNGLAPLPEPLLTEIYDAMVWLGHNVCVSISLCQFNLINSLPQEIKYVYHYSNRKRNISAYCNLSNKCRNS